jgi:AcrR family transcriptional regulator
MNGVDGRTRRAEAQRTLRKTAILQAALVVFSERGYHGTSITHIVAEAGVARGTFYQYFDGKKAIFLELLESLLTELKDSIVGVDQRPEAPPLDDQLLDTVRRIFSVVHDNRSITTIVFREAVGLDADVDQLLKTFYAGLQQYIIAALQVGQSLGAVRPLNHEVVANCIVGSLRQVAHYYLVDHPDRPFDPRQIAMEVVQLHLHGVMSSRR